MSLSAIGTEVEGGGYQSDKVRKDDWSIRVKIPLILLYDSCE